jgi:hypothetical protein
MPRALTILAAVHAIYYVVTGVWPIVHIRSFLAVTGPKVDLWLVKIVGALITVVGGVIAMASWRGRIDAEIVTLAVGCAAMLAAVDVIYVLKRVIAPIYLGDAVAEAGLIGCWLIFWYVRR